MQTRAPNTFCINHLVRYFTVIVLVFLALGSISSTAFFVITGYTPVFFWDQWEVYKRIGSIQSPVAAFEEGWVHHAGHRMVIPYFAFWLNGQLFGWSNATLLSLSAFLQICLAGLFIIEILRSTPEDPNTSRVSIAAVITALLFYGAQIENFIWGMQLSFFLTFTLAGLALFANSRESRTIAVIAAIGSSFSMINGLLVWPALLVQAFILRRRFISYLWPFIAALGISLIYVQNWQYLHGGGLEIVESARQFLKYLGGPANVVSGYFASFCGASLLVLLIVLVYRELRCERAFSSLASRSFFWGITAFSFGTVLLMVMGRDQTPVGISEGINLPSRYNTDILILWASATSLAWMSRLKAFLIVPVLLLVISASSVLPVMIWWSSFFGEETKSVAQALCHGRDHPAMFAIHPDRPTLTSVTRQVKERHQAFGAEAWCLD